MNGGVEPRDQYGERGHALWTGQWTIGRGPRAFSRVHQLYLWNPARWPTGIDLKRLISGTGWWSDAIKR